jgi:carbon-monoxide dehydrogenase small subunit
VTQPDPFAPRAVVVHVNGRAYRRVIEPRRLLSDFLRDDLGLKGTHVGCEHGVCGSCTVLFDGEPVRACLMFAVQADGHELVTVEGLAEGEELTALQESFSQHHALQCGFCTPGMLLAATALLRRNPNPSREEVEEGIGGQICRCTGYESIVQAVLAAAGRPPTP